MHQLLYGIENLAPGLKGLGVTKLFLVCGKSYFKTPVKAAVDALGMEVVRFSGFTPNPDYDDICQGTELFKASGCDGILAVGGGSAIDVAKCIKLFSSNNEGSALPFVVVPTTAGSGSEADFNAVIYRNGEKQSVAHECLLPDIAILEPMVLASLPPYQRRCTLMDALSQAIEAWWSLNSTPASQAHSRAAIRLIMSAWHGYIFNDFEPSYRNIISAAYQAGRAIAIAQTTAAHAMCYKLTTRHGLAHGHAVSLSLPRLWEWMLEHPQDCTDPRGWDYVSGVFDDIADAMGADSPREAIALFDGMMAEMGLAAPELGAEREAEIELLANTAKVKNTPVKLDLEALRALYSKVIVK